MFWVSDFTWLHVTLFIELWFIFNHCSLRPICIIPLILFILSFIHLYINIIYLFSQSFQSWVALKSNILLNYVGKSRVLSFINNDLWVLVMISLFIIITYLGIGSLLFIKSYTGNTATHFTITYTKLRAFSQERVTCHLMIDQLLVLLIAVPE